MIPNITGISSKTDIVLNPAEADNKNITDLAKKTLDPISDGTTNYFLTRGNITRLELATGSVLATGASIASYVLYGSIATILGPTLATILPIPLLAIAGYSALQAYSTPDYDNTLEVAKYREEAKSSPLEEIFQKHGKWVSERKLLTQNQVTQKYIDETGDIKTVPALLAYHQKIEKLIKNTESDYTLPNPKVHQKRLQKDCIALSYDELVKHHALENIFDWELLSPENLIENYLKKEGSLRGLPAICDFYQKTENSRKQFDTGSAYSIPNPIRLQKKIQEDCKQMSLKDIENLHTLNYLFSWQLLTPSDFSPKYQEHVDHLFTTEGINSVIAYYKKTQEIRNTNHTTGISYEIPHPESFSKRWMALDASLEKIVLHSNLNELIEYKIIQDPSLIQSLKTLQSQFKSVQKTYENSVRTVEKEYQTSCTNEKQRFKSEKGNIEVSLELLYKNQREKELRIKDIENELSRARFNGDYANVRRLEEKLHQTKTENFLKDLFTTDVYTLKNSLDKAEGMHRYNMDQIQNRKTKDLFNIALILTKEKKELEDQYTQVKKTLNK